MRGADVPAGVAPSRADFGRRVPRGAGARVVKGVTVSLHPPDVHWLAKPYSVNVMEDEAVPAHLGVAFKCFK